MFVLNRTVFVGTEGGPNSIILSQEGPVYVVKQTRASYSFMLFVILSGGPQWPILVGVLSQSLWLTGIFTAMFSPLLWIWVQSLRAFSKNPHLRIDTLHKKVVLEKGRINKKYVTINPENVSTVDIVYTLYQNSKGEANSNFILEIVSPVGKKRSLCISDNLYLIRKIGYRVAEATDAEFNDIPIDDPTHHNVWDWRYQRKKSDYAASEAPEQNDRRQRSSDRRHSDRSKTSPSQRKTPAAKDKSAEAKNKKNGDPG